MKKQFSLEIQNPCNENFSKMTPNEQGSFCSSCAKNVIDLSKKSNAEIAKILANSKESSICARLKTSQLDEVFEYTETSKFNNFKYATAIAATVLLSSGVAAQEKQPVKTEVDVAQERPIMMGKIAPVKPVKKQISFSIVGKLLDSKTKKPLSAKAYPNLTIYIEGASDQVKINPKTGSFEVPVVLDSAVKQVNVSISSDDKSYNNNYKIDLKTIKNNKLNLNIIINPEEALQSYHIMGGMGIVQPKLKSKN